MNVITLNLLRFQELADAYGADIDRWPPLDRVGASALIAVDPESAGPILARASELDGWLDASLDPPPASWLIEAIIASAPRPRLMGSRRRWGIGLGAGLAAASVAGVLAGSAAAPIAASRLHGQPVDTASEAARWLGEPGDMAEG